MREWEAREHLESLAADLPPIDERHYGLYSDFVGRIGVEWVEKTIMEYEEEE